MAKPRYGQKQTNPILRWAYLVLFALSSLWLVTSIIAKKSPIEVLSSFFSAIPNPAVKNRELLIASKDSLILDLETKLEACQSKGSYKRGMIIVDSETMNLRSEPSLVSEVVMRIPANSEVEVMYYDTKTFYLNGKPGKWCKIRYAGTEGWAWGNFIQQF